MNRKLNVGIIGLGRLGRAYARYFLGNISNATLVAVSDVNEKVQQAFADENDIAKRYADYGYLLADPEIDAVVIVTPTNTHKDIVIEAASQGKAVFCEKPLALSVDDCQAMKAAIAKAGIFFHLGFMRRFDAGYAAAKRKIEEGAIGKPILLKSSSRDPFRPSLEYLDPKNSGGLFTDCGIHDFDLARWFMGEVESVYSIGGTLVYPEINEIGDVDNAVTTLQFRSGSLGVIDLSRSGIYGYDIRTEILGSEGTLQIGYLRETPLLVLRKNEVSHDTVPYFMERFGQAYQAQLQQFVDRCRSGQEPTITCDDGLAALRVSLAATQSYQEKRPVRIPG
jgi:scyllo-inositol 2-dehydrogenase (NAD+)